MEPYKELAATMKYNFARGLTLYVRFGDWFAWSCLAIGLAGVVFAANYGV
jgi:apolipoprotein N-acyltransferase